VSGPQIFFNSGILSFAKPAIHFFLKFLKKMFLKNQEKFNFTAIKNLETTSIKNQAHSSTRWSFSTISFVESELLRMGNKPMNLSEIFVVRQTYPRKAR